VGRSVNRAYFTPRTPAYPPLEISWTSTRTSSSPAHFFIGLSDEHKWVDNCHGGGHVASDMVQKADLVTEHTQLLAIKT
jgi:hypothetical protein